MDGDIPGAANPGGGPLREVGVPLADRPPEAVEEEFGRELLAGGGFPTESSIAFFAVVEASGAVGPFDEAGLAIIGGPWMWRLLDGGTDGVFSSLPAAKPFRCW